MFSTLLNNIRIRNQPKQQPHHDLNAEIVKQNCTINELNHEIIVLKKEIVDLKTELITQQIDMKKEFEKQKEYFVEGIKQILLTLENERLNNDRLILEIDGLRQTNHDLELENRALKNKLKI